MIVNWVRISLTVARIHRFLVSPASLPLTFYRRYFQFAGTHVLGRSKTLSSCRFFQRMKVDRSRKKSKSHFLRFPPPPPLPPVVEFHILLYIVGFMTGPRLACAHVPHGGVVVIVRELVVVRGVLGGPVQDVDFRFWQLVYVDRLA